MAKRSVPATDRPPTAAQRKAAIEKVVKSGGAAQPPANRLAHKNPATTCAAVADVLDYLAGEEDGGRSEILRVCADALGHAESLITFSRVFGEQS
jgi:hypothetical protein